MSFISSALREWAFNVGQDRLDRQWLLTDYDSWEKNPHYRGPDQGHPEQFSGLPYEAWYDGDPKDQFPEAPITLQSLPAEVPTFDEAKKLASAWAKQFKYSALVERWKMGWRVRPAPKRA